MRRDINKLSEEEYDLLIIGGGVNGLATAWDATLRGLKVALIEKGDFGGATSAASLKIIHGGLRYLQHVDFPRMKESIRERSNLLRILPHLIDPFPFMVPAYGHGMKGKEALAIAMKMNDFISRNRNKNLKDEEQHLPNGKIISKKACLELAPHLKQDGLKGAAVFYDGRMHNADRVNLEFALAADSKGADLANYVSAQKINMAAGRIHSVRVKDELSGEEFEIKAKVVAGLMGPWSDLLPRLLDEESVSEEVVKSAGIQIITPAVTKEGMGLGVMSDYVDPDAKIARGGRHYFTTPWRGMTIWGTTDKIYRGKPEEWKIEEADIEEFIIDINHAVHGINLERSQVVNAFGGLRPVSDENIDAGSQVSRKAEIMDHEEDLNIENLISAEGVKYTTCRLLAEKMTDLVYVKLNIPTPACKTETTPLFGGDFSTRAELRAHAEKIKPEGLAEKAFDYLVRSYGAKCTALLERIAQKPAEAQLLRDSDEIPMVCIHHAIENEQAKTIDDVLLRRTDAGTLMPPTEAMRSQVAELL